MELMQQKILKNISIFQVLFFLICIFYILFYMPFGFEGTDTGYIFGSSWNVYNGQLPHRDFIYTRPAIPAYFHTLFLFISETYAYILDRSFFYVQVFFYSFLAAKLLCEKFEIHSKSSLYFIATLGALISIHNYPPMGWNTIDGIFFTVIGFYFILKNNSKCWMWFLGTFFLVLGVFSKQSFYFVPIFLFVYLLLLKDFKKLLYYSIFGVFWVLVYIGIKYLNGTWEPFLQQTFVRTEGNALVSVGIKTYYLAVKLNLLYILASILGFWASYKFLPKKFTYVLLNLGIAGIISFQFYEDFPNWQTLHFIMQILFFSCVLYCLYKGFKDNRFWLPLLLLTVSWCASISMGYQTPIHFSLPIVFVLYLFIFSSEVKKFPKQIALSVLAIFLATFYFGYQSLYRDASRRELTKNMGEVFPQLTFIKTDVDTYNKYAELKILAEKYPNFLAVPTMTLSHYLTKTVNPVGTDWPHDVEINFGAQHLVEELKAKKTIIFIENSEFSEKELSDYEIITLVKQSYKLIEKTFYFSVYSLPKQ